MRAGTRARGTTTLALPFLGATVIVRLQELQSQKYCSRRERPSSAASTTNSLPSPRRWKLAEHEGLAHFCTTVTLQIERILLSAHNLSLIKERITMPSS